MNTGMIRSKNCIVMDIDGTLCPAKKPDECYSDLPPHLEIVDRLRQYREQGFYIILFTSRNMRTYEANIGLILANTARVVFDWLDRNEIPYDEIHFGKPWPGRGGFYVDDKAIRPDEFLKLDYKSIQDLVGHE